MASGEEVLTRRHNQLSLGSRESRVRVEEGRTDRGDVPDRGRRKVTEEVTAAQVSRSSY